MELLLRLNTQRMSQLNVTYRDGSKRIIRLHPEFFSVKPIPGVRIPWGSPQERAMTLALSYGNHPYHIILTRGDKILMDHISKENRPFEKAPPYKNLYWKKEKKKTPVR